MSLTNLLAEYLRCLSSITVGFAILFALIALCLKTPPGKKKDLEFVINRAFSGGALPTGLALLGCAIKPELLPKLNGAGLNVAVAGITLLFISIRSVFASN